MTILNPEHLGVRPWQQSENAKIRQETPRDRAVGNAAASALAC
jgi:hypothetical protein